MSWSNPTPEEAEDNYYYYKNRYNAAAEQRAQSERREAGYYAKKLTAANKMSDLSSQKLNFEKRIQQINQIILDLTGASVFNNIPSIIAQGAKTLQRTDESYRCSIRAREIFPADIIDAFDIKPVVVHPYSAAALEKYQKEKQRLEQAVEDLKAQIASLSATIDSLNSAIANCNSEQMLLRGKMLTSAYEMNHYKGYMD